LWLSVAEKIDSVYRWDLMGKYNFENDNNEFDKTIALGDLNKEIKSLEAEMMQETKPVRPVKQTADRERRRNSSSGNRKKKSNDVRMFTIVAVALLFIGIFCVSAMAVRNMFTNNTKPSDQNIENAADVFGADSEGEMLVIKA